MRQRSTFAAGIAIAVAAACGGQVAGGSSASSTDAGTQGAGDGAADGASADAAVPYLVTCSAPGDCVLEPLSCCGACAGATAASFTAIERGQESTYETFQCPTAEPCAPCMAPFEDLDIQAFCVSGACVVVDVRTDDLSACMIDADCIPRTGACCECPIPDGPNAVIAIRADQSSAYAAQVCPAGEVCPSCTAHYQVTAVCDQSTHHCVIADGR